MSGRLTAAHVTEAKSVIQGIQNALDGWQPIETAPMDTPVLVWLTSDGDHFGHRGATAMRAIWSGGQCWMCAARFSLYALDADDQPTHWMPLPPPPRA